MLRTVTELSPFRRLSYLVCTASEIIDKSKAVRTSPPTFVQTATSLSEGLEELMNPQSRPEPSAAAQRDSTQGSEAIQLIIVPDVIIRHQVNTTRTKALAYLKFKNRS